MSFNQIESGPGELVVCGRLIGTYDGWNQAADKSIMFYDFKPVEQLRVPEGDLMIEYEPGVLSVLCPDGRIKHTEDVVNALQRVERATPLVQWGPEP